MNKIVIPAILAATVLVAGFALVSVLIPQVYAPHISPATCPGSGVVEHWDKIVFKILRDPSGVITNIPLKTELDIKVLDDPNHVADIKQKVRDFLQDHGLVTDASNLVIEIVDVEYAIVCRT